MWCKYCLVSLLVLLGVLAVGLKIVESQSVAPNYERDLGGLADYMGARGLSLEEAFDLNREGSFKAYIYRYRECDGGLLVSPMYRNSEAVSLFERQAVYRDYSMGAVFYFLDGGMYEEFPDMALWISQKMNVAKRIVRMGSGSMPLVLALRSYGRCGPRLE